MGEQLEQVFSLGKPVFLLARYMTPPNWWASLLRWGTSGGSREGAGGVELGLGGGGEG